MHFESYSASEAHVTAGCKCVGSVLMQGERRVGEGVGQTVSSQNENNQCSSSVRST